MTDSEFRQIASFALETEAGQFKSLLEENGISAFIDGANANTMLSYIVGGIKLLVHTPTLREPPKSLARELTIPRGPVRRGEGRKARTRYGQESGRGCRRDLTAQRLRSCAPTPNTQRLGRAPRSIRMRRRFARQRGAYGRLEGQQRPPETRLHSACHQPVRVGRPSPRYDASSAPGGEFF